MFQKGCENVIICDIQGTIELKLLEQLHTQIKILLQHGVKISKVFSEYRDFEQEVILNVGTRAFKCILESKISNNR